MLPLKPLIKMNNSFDGKKKSIIKTRKLPLRTFKAVALKVIFRLVSTAPGVEVPEFICIHLKIHNGFR